MKKTLLVIHLILLPYLSAMGFIAAPSEFPNAFVDAVQQNIERTTNMIQDFDEISCVVGPISLMSKTSSLSNVKKFHAQLEELTMSEVAGTHIDNIRLSGLYKLSVPLVIEMNRQLLIKLAKLDELLEFWKEAEDYYVHYFLHKKSPREIVRKLEIHQEELYELLGTIAIHVNAIPLSKDAKTQYEWLRVLCNHFNSCLPRQKTIVTKPIFEAVSAMFAKAISSVEKFSESCESRVQRYAKPSWIRRNCFGVVGGAAALFAGGSSAVKYEKQITDGAQTVKESAQTYANATADALWGNDQKWERDLGEKEDDVRRYYERTLKNLLPYFTPENKQVKTYLEELPVDFLNKFNKQNIEDGAVKLDLHYFGEVVSLVADALSKEGTQVTQVAQEMCQILENTDLGQGNNVWNTMADVVPFMRKKETKFEYKEYGHALKAIAETMKGKLQILDTATEAPNLAMLGGRIAAVKGERKFLEIWRKTKLLVMAAIGYFVFRVGKDVAGPPISYLIKRSWPKDSSYDGLLETLRELKKLFLVNGDKQQSEMDPYDVGLTYYLVHRLERVMVPKKYRKKFLQDVRLLQASNFTAHQKYNIVKDVLQDGYPFLRPLAQAA